MQKNICLIYMLFSVRCVHICCLNVFDILSIFCLWFLDEILKYTYKNILICFWNCIWHMFKCLIVTLCSDVLTFDCCDFVTIGLFFAKRISNQDTFTILCFVIYLLGEAGLSIGCPAQRVWCWQQPSWLYSRVCFWWLLWVSRSIASPVALYIR